MTKKNKSSKTKKTASKKVTSKKVTSKKTAPKKTRTKAAPKKSRLPTATPVSVSPKTKPPTATPVSVSPKTKPPTAPPVSVSPRTKPNKTKWIAEAGELKGMSKADVTALKESLPRQRDATENEPQSTPTSSNTEDVPGDLSAAQMSAVIQRMQEAAPAEDAVVGDTDTGGCVVGDTNAEGAVVEGTLSMLEQFQSENRQHRPGQHNPVTYVDLVADKTVGDTDTGGAIVGGTDPCTCGYAPEEHGRDANHPGWTGCVESECVAYEADPGSTD